MVKTFYCRSTTNHVGAFGPSSTENKDLELTSGTTGSRSINDTADWFFYSATSEPNFTDWPGGTYTWYLRITTANVVFDLTNVKLHRANSSVDAILATKTSAVNTILSAVQTYSGTIDWNDDTQNPVGRSQSDRFIIEFEYVKTGGHGGDSIDFAWDGPTDTRVDTPLEEAAGTLFERSVNESLTISDASPTIQIGRKLSIEPLTIATATTIQVNRFVTDSFTITDDVDGLKSVPRSVAESLESSDTGGVTRFLRANKSLSESFTVDDVVNKMAAFFRTLSESFTVEDAVTGVLHYSRSVVESLTIVESAIKLMIGRFLSESLTIIDAVNIRIGIVLSESFEVADTVARFFHANRNVSETPTITDVVNILINRFVSESLELSDTIKIQIGRFLLESLEITSDDVTRFLRGNKSVSESLTIDAVVVRILTAMRSMSESLTVDGVAAGALHFSRSVSESFTITDNVVRFYKAIRSVSESLTVDAVVARMARFFRSISESLTVVDTVTGALHFSRSVSESLTVDDVVARFYHAIRNISESLTIDDVSDKIASFSRSVSNELEITDMVARLISILRTVSGSLTVDGGTVSKMYTAMRSVTESLTVNGIVDRMATMMRSVSDSLTINGVVASLRTASKTDVSDSFTVTDDVEITTSAVGIIIRNVSESLTVAANVVRKACRVLPFLH